MADAITATPAKVTPDLRERLQQRFSTPQLVELAAALGDIERRRRVRTGRRGLVGRGGPAENRLSNPPIPHHA